MSSIGGSDAGDVWRPLTPSQYPAEQVLHDLVERPGAEAFRTIIADAPDDQQPLLIRLAGWAQELQLSPTFGDVR